MIKTGAKPYRDDESGGDPVAVHAGRAGLQGDASTQRPQIPLIRARIRAHRVDRVCSKPRSVGR